MGLPAKGWDRDKVFSELGQIRALKARGARVAAVDAPLLGRRYKDVRNWWANAHYDRPGGVTPSDSRGLTGATGLS